MPDSVWTTGTARHRRERAVVVFAFDRRGVGMAKASRLTGRIGLAGAADGEFERDAVLTEGIACQSLIGAHRDRSPLFGESSLQVLHPLLG